MVAVGTRERTAYLVGRLQGLAGTVRYKVEPEMRIELKEIASLLVKMTENQDSS